MTVYVDDMYKYDIGAFGRMKMSHMKADTLSELHEMAFKIGVSRRFFQNKSKHLHYDVSISKRLLAIKNGAKEISMREMVGIQTRIDQ